MTMAQQLTLVELERMSYIGPEEFVQSFARERLETAARDAKRTKNLECYLQWCDRLSALVASEVCKNTSKERRRSESLEFWLEVARQAFNIGNFNSMMAIISGLGAQPVSRLSNTWTKELRGELNTLEKQMDADSDFYSYRSTLRASKWKNGSGGQRVIIPFFPLLLKDLYALCEDCSTRLPNGHVNFEASWRLATGVTEFVAWKQVVCRYENNSKVIAFLETSPTLTENALMLSSFECEGPTNDHEKEHYNFLKSVNVKKAE